MKYLFHVVQTQTKADYCRIGDPHVLDIKLINHDATIESLSSNLDNKQNNIKIRSLYFILFQNCLLEVGVKSGLHKLDQHACELLHVFEKNFATLRLIQLSTPSKQC